MPPRKSAEKATCELCCDALEKGQDTLKCEGECGCVVHHYCAGVTKRHFDSLNKDRKPFVCQWCSMKMSRSVIEQLQAEIISWKAEVASLKSDLTATKEALAKQREQTERTPTGSYASVASQLPQLRSRQHHQGQRQGPCTNTSTRAPAIRETSTAESATHARSSTAGAATDPRSRARVKVEGARRIWGTHPHATTRTVENAIDRFCNIQGLNIRRKVSRNNQSGKSSWWFVIHAEESVLNDLESKWDSLSTQTSWLLKSCSKPRDVEDSGSTLSPSVSESDTGNPTTTQLATDANSHSSSTPTDQSPTTRNLSQSSVQNQSSQQDYSGTGTN